MPGWDEPDPYADVRGTDEVPLDDASLRLRDVIRRVEGRVADLAAADLDEDDETTGPEQDLQQRMAQLCADDGAPLEWRSILDRVQRGTQTWRRLYARPRAEEGPAGVALVREAMNASAADVMATLTAGIPDIEAKIDQFNRERFKRS